MGAEISGDLCHGDHEWFFFIPRQEREARGGRPNRLTTSGYWKATGSPGHVYSSGQNSRIIGGKRTMVYYEGRAPHGRKTEWKMNEYKAIDGEAATSNTANPPVFTIANQALYPMLLISSYCPRSAGKLYGLANLILINNIYRVKYLQLKACINLS